MNQPQRLPPGPVKRYDRYFTIPINKDIFIELEKLKWRIQLDKTEVMRRLLDYFLTLPPEAQDKMLKSFDTVYENETQRLRAMNGRNTKRKVAKRHQHKETAEARTVRLLEGSLSKLPEQPPMFKAHAGSVFPEAPKIVRSIKRSGLP